MSSKKSAHHHRKRKKKHITTAETREQYSVKSDEPVRLEIVLRCDTSGCTEAIISSLTALSIPEVSINIISSGVGSVSQSDIFMAETGSKLIIGFNVWLMPQIDQLAAEHNVEIRLYEVIYKLIDDVKSIAGSFVAREITEQVTANAGKLKEQMESIAPTLSSFNGVYGGMLSAMNKN